MRRGVSDPSDVRGALGGSRLLLQPAHAEKVAAYRAALAGARPVLIEVGFDHGRRLVSSARHAPGWTFVGLEIRRKRVEEVVAWAERDGLENLFAWRIDARTVLATVTPPGSVDIVEVLFPTPWEDDGTARARRRLLDDRFVDDVAQALKPGGLWHFETDVAWYADAFDALVADHAELVLVANEIAAEERPANQQLSRRQWKCEREGTPVHVRWLRRGRFHAPQDMSSPCRPT